MSEAAPSSSSSGAIVSTLQENRLFPPPSAFAAKALISSKAEYEKLYRESIDDPEAFFGRMAGELHWFKKWDRVLEWNPPGATESNDERLAFVGKAVVFDTGGISIKPSGGMEDMKLDKSGGCAVLGAMKAIAATSESWYTGTCVPSSRVR